MGHFCLPPGSGSTEPIESGSTEPIEFGSNPDPLSRLNPDPDPLSRLNPDPDPQPLEPLKEHMTASKHDLLKKYFSTFVWGHFCPSGSGSGSATLEPLKEHMTVHTGARPYLCVGCGLYFSKKSNLARHSLLHLDHKPCRYKLRAMLKGQCHEMRVGGGGFDTGPVFSKCTGIQRVCAATFLLSFEFFNQSSF